MKRLTIILLLVAVAAGVAQAQFRYGFRFGGDIAIPHAPKAVDEKGGSGFAGGLTCEWQAENSGFAAGLSALYDHRPVTWEEASPRADYPDPLRFTLGKDYITVPVDFKYKFWMASVSDLAAPYIVTGPELAMRMGSGCGSRLHAGWNIGVGFDIINFIQLSAAYRFGLNTPAAHIRDSGLNISLTLLFDP